MIKQEASIFFFFVVVFWEREREGGKPPFYLKAKMHIVVTIYCDISLYRKVRAFFFDWRKLRACLCIKNVLQTWNKAEMQTEFFFLAEWNANSFIIYKKKSQHLAYSFDFLQNLSTIDTGCNLNPWLKLFFYSSTIINNNLSHKICCDSCENIYYIP